MNLNLNMLNLERNQNIIPFDVFSKSLQDKLIELGYKKEGSSSSTSSTTFYLFYYNKKKHTVPDYYEYFCINSYFGYVLFINSIENNPFECCNKFSSPLDFTKENLDKLFEKATNYAANSKKCKIQAKLDEIEKDF